MCNVERNSYDKQQQKNTSVKRKEKYEVRSMTSGADRQLLHI